MDDEPLAEGLNVEWEFQRRDDSEPHWPLGEQGNAVVEIPRWDHAYHGTYSATVRETKQGATQTIPPALRVALSGGGYRAMLFGLGALMYLVDVEAHPRIEDVTSVSGGSIANAIVLDRCDLSTTTRDEFWKVAKDVAERATRSCVMRDRRLPEAARIGLLLLLLVAALMGLLLLTDPAVTAVALALVPLVLTFRGFAVEGMLKHRFGLTSHLHEPRRRVSHVFCATDLVAGEPFYFLAMRSGGFFYSRRRGAARTEKYPVRKAVRASAAFPFAFLPKRVGLGGCQFEWGQQPGTQTVRYCGGRAFCADGGVANNLGTQWFEENETADWPYRTISPLTQGTSWRPAREMIEITIDASVPLEPGSSTWFAVPIVAELRSISRVIRVLYENTLRPRRSAAEWAASVLAEKGYAAVVAGDGVTVQERGTHRRILVPLEPTLLSEASELSRGENLMMMPFEVIARGMGLTETLRDVVGAENELDHLPVLARAQRMPTTLFKTSRGETVDALLGGYIAAFINCHTYEELGTPRRLAETIDRIRSLGKPGA